MKYSFEILSILVFYFTGSEKLDSQAGRKRAALTDRSTKSTTEAQRAQTAHEEQAGLTADSACLSILPFP